MRKIHLPANVEFVGIPEIPALTAKAAHPVDIEGRTSVTLYQVQMQHAGALRAAINDRTVVPLDRMSFGRVPDTDEGAYTNAVITRADFEKFAKSLFIEVVLDVAETAEPLDDDHGAPGLDMTEAQDAAAKEKADTELANLFDGVGTAALEKMFPTSPTNPTNTKWGGWAERAKRNGLCAARIRNGQFNPYQAARWWLDKQNPEGWDWSRCVRALANNLPPRSRGSRSMLTGEID